jgi:two-component system phosphate regulon response regulator PhoB
MAMEKILVVDDEEAISSYLQRKLTKLGYSVCVAADGESAVALAFSTLPDIILMDVKLPKLTGTEACRKLKDDERTRAIPVLLLSAKAQPAEIQAGLDAGADKYLCKPMSFPDILAEIREFENV